MLKARYTYDGMSRLASVVDVVNGRTTRYEYDILGRPTVERLLYNSNNNVFARLDLRYDDTKNRLAGYDVTGALISDQAVDYVYNTDVERPDFISGVKYNGTQMLTYTYDELGRLSSRVVRNDTGSFVYSTDYMYRPGRRVKSDDRSCRRAHILDRRGYTGDKLQL